MVLQLPNEVLFDSGRTDLKPNEKKTLGTIAQVFRSQGERFFQVAGPPDNFS